MVGFFAASVAENCLRIKHDNKASLGLLGDRAHNKRRQEGKND